MSPRPDSTFLLEAIADVFGGRGDVYPADAAGGAYLHDGTASRGINGHADAVAVPYDTGAVADLLAWCNNNRIPVTVRGGGTGLAGGAVPSGGVVLSLEGLNRIRSFEPDWWRMEVEAGVTTAEARGLAAGAGLYLPPDPGSAGRSTIGGNVATNAAGPHSFKYGPFSAWVTGLEVVLASGEILLVGGRVRKDVAGYDLKSLFVGSEGELGVVTAVRLRLIPMPASRLPAVFSFPNPSAAQRAMAACMRSGVSPAAIEFLDAATMRNAGSGLDRITGDGFDEASFVLIVETDGSADEASASRRRIASALEPDADGVWLPDDLDQTGELWRWRSQVSDRIVAAAGGKAGEDICVPTDRLAEAVEGVHRVAADAGLEACCWGHAGDGNVHANLLVGPQADQTALAATTAKLFELALSLGGTITGEHGVGRVKRQALPAQLGPVATGLNHGLKQVFDPNRTLNRREPARY